MSFLRRLARAVNRDAIDDVGAMMAYYVILAVFPMMLFVVTVAALVVPPAVIAESARIALETVPSSTRSLLASQVDTLVQSAHAGLAVGTLAIALWGASRGASGLMLALDRVFGKVETRSWLRRQGIALALTIGLAALMLVALGLLVIGPTIGHVVADRLALGSAFDIGLSVARWLGAGLLMMVVWALAYRFLPDTDVPFRIFTPGATVGVVLWLGISRLFGVYLDHFGGYTSIYGAFGSAVVLLIWLWLSSMALLLGAEINELLAELRQERATAGESQVTRGASVLVRWRS